MADLQNTQQTQKFQNKLAAVEALCTTETDGRNGQETTLADWMIEGYWREMSAADIAAEWDALSEE